MSLYIDLYSPTCGSKEKQNTHTHTMKYNKQEKKQKIKQKGNEQVFMALCKLNYVQYYYRHIIATLARIKFRTM